MKAKAYWNTTEKLITLTCQDGNSEYEPLLTEQEWRARHPLSLRKLGEGEKLKHGGCYYTVMPDGWQNAFRNGYECEQAGHATYYELSTPSSEEPEAKHVPMDRVGTKRVQFTEPTPMPVRKLEEPAPADSDHIAAIKAEHAPPPNDGTKPWHRCPTCGGDLESHVCEACGRDWTFEAVPAPNQVGERLTEPPEVGTPVVQFQDNGRWLAYVWGLNSCWFTRICLYRWLGPIPQEPKPEKPEPPKWLGAVRAVADESYIGFVSGISDNFVNLVHASGKAGGPCAVSKVTLAPDIMPPSPALAALFGEEGQQ